VFWHSAQRSAVWGVGVGAVSAMARFLPAVWCIVSFLFLLKYGRKFAKSVTNQLPIPLVVPSFYE
jgi:hypothetical protein